MAILRERVALGAPGRPLLSIPENMNSTAEHTKREQIARLEGEIERLTDSVVRCRKIALAAKVAIGAGCILLASLLAGAVGMDALSLMLSAIVIIGGIVLLGSNDTTSRQLLARIEETERRRAALIGEMELTLVAEPTRLLH